MSQEKLESLRHLIRPAIQKDKNNQFLFFYTQSLNQEMYFFLQYAYEVQEQKDDELFKSTLEVIALKFIKNGRINLEYIEKNAFLNVYEEFIVNKRSKEAILLALTTIVQKIEKLSYLNLMNEDGYIEHLGKYNKNKKNKVENNHHKSSKCTMI